MKRFSKYISYGYYASQILVYYLNFLTNIAQVSDLSLMHINLGFICLNEFLLIPSSTNSIQVHKTVLKIQETN